MIDTLPPPPAAQQRYLLCACPAHCAQVLRAASAARVQLHGLLPTCQWPPAAPHTAPALAPVLWALLPSPTTAQQTLEQGWRQHLVLEPTSSQAVHMLYGSATQQAQQLAPWAQSMPGTHAPSSADAIDVLCRECLDADSEHTLFTHLRAGK